MTNEKSWEFDRYVDGRLMAEGVRITRAENLEQATLKAVRLASPGSVLVLHSSNEPRDELAALRAKHERLLDAIKHSNWVTPTALKVLLEIEAEPLNRTCSDG